MIKHKQMIPLIVSFTMFMEAVDSTVINTAIPAMAKSLDVNPVDLKIALISYLVSLAIFIPISGWVADKFGIKKIFLSALGVFTLSSLWCGFAHNLPELVLARFIQGMGSSCGVPLGRLIIVRTFGRESLITIMNRVIMVASLGLMLGPVLGGFITHHWSWHWIFWINVPVGILVILLGLYFLPYESPQEVFPLDKLGFVIFALALAGITFSTSAMSESTVTLSRSIFILIISILLLIIYFLISRKKRNPVVKTDLLHIRTFQISVIGNLTSRLGFGGLPFLVPLLLQIGLGYSAEISGLLLAPTALGVLLAKPFSLPFLQRFGYKRLLIMNTIFAGLSIWSFIFVNNHTPLYLIGLLSFIYGFIVAVQFTGMNSLAYADLPSQNLSAATSIMGTIQQVALGFGVAVAALILRVLSPESFTLSIPIFQKAFLILGLVTILSIFVFTRLSLADGQSLIEREIKKIG